MISPQVAVSSRINAAAPFLGHGAHKAMTKVGIIGFTRGLATEFAANGITANCIGPGAIATERETH